MFQRIPEAPWIRTAENDGIPDPPPVFCPVCLEEAEIFYLDINKDVVGCDRCVSTADPYDTA